MPRKTKQYTNPFLKAKGSLVAQGSSVLPSLQSAIALHHKGQLGQAESIYLQLLEIDPRNADALHLLGVIAHQTGNHKSAVDMISHAIEINPHVAMYYSNFGNALQELKQLDDAVASYDKAIELKSDFADAYYNRGNALKELKQFDAALISSDKAIELRPNFAEAYLNRGVSLEGLNQLDAAIASFDKAIDLKPDYAEAYYNRGIPLQKLKQFDTAIASYDKVIELKPDFADAYYNRGNALLELKQLDAAVASYDKAIELRSDYAKAYSNRGNALQELKQLDAAVASYDKAIELRPDFAESYSNRASALKELKQFDAALISSDKAIELRPNFAEAYLNRGVSLEGLNQLDAAIASFDKAIDLKPDYAEAYSNRGVALGELKKLDAAVASYDKAIELKPDFAEVYWNKALTFLLLGELSQGFNLYEWRWEKQDTYKFKRNFSQPLWLGVEPLSDKTVLLHSEQGLGDTIQFCRYARMIADLGATVILEVQKPLVRLLKDISGVTTLLAQGDPLPEFDFHCPLLSLPLAFKTDLNSIPSASSYLEAGAERVVYWKDQIKGDGLKIGISWQGSKTTKVDIGRSFELKLFKNLAALPNVQLISLQKGYGSEQLKNMPSGMQVMDLGEELDAEGAFLDSAAVMMNLDLVITSDTAMAHLAGALGVKTWVALKYVPEWRWLLDRKDSPWYPSVTLYRQQKIDDWAPVFDQLLVDITLMRKES